MKLLVFIFLICIISSCGEVRSTETNTSYSPAQKSIDSMVKHYRILYQSAPNDIAKNNLKKNYLDTINLFIANKLNYIIPNCRVTLEDVGVTEISNVKAFTAKFIDNSGYEYASVRDTEYWMEFDYSENNAKNLDNNPAYTFLKDMREKTDTVISFFYLGEAEWSYISDDQLRLRVVPFPKDYNFDSSRNANSKKPKL